MNLENLNVTELNAQEMQNTDGGVLGQLLKKLGEIIVEEIIVEGAKKFVKDPTIVVSSGVDNPYGHWGGARP